jgi:glutamate synthase domain-containing protein 1
VTALFGFGKKSNEKSEKDLEKEEQYAKQQEVLNRRRTNSWQGEVKERRKEVSKYLQVGWRECPTY